MYAYSNDGMTFRNVDPAYIAQSGEVLFTDIASVAQLTAAFPQYATIATAQQSKQAQLQLLADKLKAGYADATLGVTLAIDKDSQAEITSVGAAAGIAVAVNSVAGKTFIFPTLGAPFTAPSAQAAYDLSERCREYVQGLLADAATGALTP